MKKDRVSDPVFLSFMSLNSLPHPLTEEGKQQRYYGRNYGEQGIIISIKNHNTAKKGCDCKKNHEKEEDKEHLFLFLVIVFLTQ